MNTKRRAKLTVNVETIDSEIELIDHLVAQFEFPDLYRRNCKGMEEHLFYDPMVKVPDELVVVGIEILESKVPEVALRLRKWLEGIPAVKFKKAGS